MFSILFKKNGVTLIELLIALVLSSILTAVLYRAFISQQKTYTVQDQVADMQQNVRIAMGQMTREIRMAGYGGNMLSIFGNVNGFTNIITPASNAITIILGDEVGVLKQNTPKGSNELKVSNARIFNNDKKKYLCLNGLNNYSVQSVTEDYNYFDLSFGRGSSDPSACIFGKSNSLLCWAEWGKTVLRRNQNTRWGWTTFGRKYRES